MRDGPERTGIYYTLANHMRIFQTDNELNEYGYSEVWYARSGVFLWLVGIVTIGLIIARVIGH